MTTRCPNCRTPHAAPTGEPRPKTWPFCSERCQLLDLDRWLSGEYRIPDDNPEALGDEEIATERNA